MRINIPECQKMGVSNMGTLIIIICMLEYGIKRLYNKYQVNTINDIKGYTVTCNKIDKIPQNTCSRNRRTKRLCCSQCYIADAR